MEKAVSIDSHAEAQCPWHVGLPVSAVKHKHPGEAAEEHPVRVGSHLHGYTGSQHHEHCGDKTQEGTLRALTWLRRTVGGGYRHWRVGRRTGGEGVAAVVKQLPQWRAAVGAPGLLPVDGVQRLVDEQTHGAEQVRPEWSLKQQGHVQERQKTHRSRFVDWQTGINKVWHHVSWSRLNKLEATSVQLKTIWRIF